jgi:hypothetical protein
MYCDNRLRSQPIWAEATVTEFLWSFYVVSSAFRFFVQSRYQRPEIPGRKELRMKRRMRRVLAIATLVVGGMVATQGVAFAGSPDGPAFGPNGEFLCPAVGNATAAAHNGQGWGGPTIPADGGDNFTFLPGNNQAGANANSKALNTLNPGDSPGPGGGNSDWSPIWPGSNPDPG